MEEVVAKKANLLPGLIIAAVLSVGILVIGVVVGIVAEETGALVIGIAIGGFMSAFVGFQIFKFVKQPKVLIVYSDGKFHFPDGSCCYPNEITHILLKLTRSRYGAVAKTGGMVLTVNGRKIEIKNIANVKTAEARISAICSGNTASPAPAAPAAPAPQEDNPYNI